MGFACLVTDRSGSRVFLGIHNPLIPAWWTALTLVAQESRVVGTKHPLKCCYLRKNEERHKTLVRSPAPDSLNKDGEQELEAEAASEVLEQWNILFHGSPPSDVGTYRGLRKAIEKVLGQGKDTGIYTFHEKQFKGGRKTMLGLRKKTACAGCTKKVKSTLSFTEKGPVLCVEQKGSHGKLQPPQGGSLWTCAEALALEVWETKRPRVTSKDVRAALQEKGLKLRCSNPQLHNFVARFHGAGPQQRKKGQLTVSQLETAATLHMSPHMDAWESWKVWRLISLTDCDHRCRAGLYCLDTSGHAATRASLEGKGFEACGRCKATHCVK